MLGMVGTQEQRGVTHKTEGARVSSSRKESVKGSGERAGMCRGRNAEGAVWMLQARSSCWEHHLPRPAISSCTAASMMPSSWLAVLSSVWSAQPWSLQRLGQGAG